MPFWAETMKNVALIAIAFILLIYAGAGNFAQERLTPKKAGGEMTQDAGQRNDHDTTISSNIFYSVVQVSHLVFHTSLIFEYKLPVINETKAHSVILTSRNVSQFYRILFRAIISPNAP